MTAPKATEIHVRNWDKFQHRDVTKHDANVPVWIRLYTELGSKQEFRALTMHQRGVLASIWIEYARSGRRLPGNTATLTRQLGQRVTAQDLAALNHAGFIEIRQADVKPASSLEEKREEKRLEKKPLPTTDLQVTQPDELAQRRHQHGLEINGRPGNTTLAAILDELATKAT